MGNSSLNTRSSAVPKNRYLVYRSILFSDALELKDPKGTVYYIRPRSAGEFTSYSCCVCGHTKDSVTLNVDNLSIDFTVKGIDRYYVVPTSHKACRDILAINPLAYDDED